MTSRHYQKKKQKDLWTTLKQAKQVGNTDQYFGKDLRLCIRIHHREWWISRFGGIFLGERKYALDAAQLYHLKEIIYSSLPSLYDEKAWQDEMVRHDRKKPINR